MVNLADITNTTTALTPTNKTARAVYFRVVSGAGVCRVGDADTAANHGLAVLLGTPLTFDYQGDEFAYSTKGIFVYVPSGTILSVGYEPTQA